MAALSGGVDSAVAAKLLLDAGKDLSGGIMRLIPGTEQDISDAEAIANKLGIRFYVFDFGEDFKEKVIKNFVCDYEKGLTPNPCIYCNRFLKFEKLLQAAKELGCEKIATGHYAQIQKADNGRYIIKKAADSTKDQSYVLYSLSQEQLSHIILPLGGYSKAQIREIASDSGFINADKKDSQDICFVPNGDYAEFIRSYTGRDYPAGNYIDKLGNVLGHHSGIINYTVGQRKGLGIALGSPKFVIEKNVPDNTVTLGENADLFKNTVRVKNINLISVESLTTPMRVTAKLRYRHAEQPATVIPIDNNTADIVFDEPQRAATPGQSAVFYDNDILVGGGIIE